MKNIAIISLLLLGFALFQFISARLDYSWDSKYLDAKGSGWLVFKKFNNSISPIYIYSIFNPPVTRIGIIDKNSLAKVSGSIYFVNSVWVDREVGVGGVKEEPFSYYLDCDRFVTGNNENQHRNPKDNINLQTIEWTSEETLKEYPEAIETYKDECKAIEDFLSN